MNALLTLHPVSAVLDVIYLAVFGALLIELRYRIGGAA